MTSHLFADRYEPLEDLGAGGFGHAWRALDHHLGTEVALKMFHPGQPFSNALLEAQRLMSLEGPHILRVYNADAHADVPYIVTEYAPLGSAEKRMRPHGVAPPLAVRWTSDVLLGLDLCHGRGLLHRDVSPGNFFLKDESHARLGDFGVAEFMDRNGNAPAHGAPVIRAPEAWTTGEGGIAADIYSAGVSLYALLAGGFPFDGPTIQAQIVAGTYTRLRDAAPHVPRRLAMRVERAMSKKPADRYRSAREMANDLSAAILGVRCWMAIPPHAGHEHCWEEYQPPQTPVDVCVVSSIRPNAFEIVTRRASGSKSRLTAHCHTGVPAGRLATRLRHIFDALD